jgi:hypothetical protein
MAFSVEISSGMVKSRLIQKTEGGSGDEHQPIRIHGED